MDFNNMDFVMPKNRSAAIKVIGVGGGGSNAVNYMFKQGITGVDFIVSNTDAQALDKSPVPIKIQLGANITEGLGAGANPEVGEQAALETLDDIKNILDSNTKMVFITAGMGGGTGTGAAPIIAKCAREMGILTVGICTAPFSFEGRKRLDQAKEGIEKLRSSVDSLIIINNDKLRELYGNLGYKTGFAKADEVLSTAAKGIAEVITHEYSINIDLRDAKTVLADSGTAIMGSAKASGESKAKKAIEAALDSPLLNDNKITGAKNVLLLIVSGDDEITMDEIGIINDYIQTEAGYNANIIMGMGEDKDLGDEISVTIVATGFPLEQQDFNGQEDKTIVHTLEDEHHTPIHFSISQKEKDKKESATEDNIVHSKPASSATENSNKEYSEEEGTEEENIFNFQIINQLEAEEKGYKDEVYETETENQINFNQDEPELKEPENELMEKNSSKYTLFSLDEDWDDEPETPSVSRNFRNQETAGDIAPRKTNNSNENLKIGESKSNFTPPQQDASLSPKNTFQTQEVEVDTKEEPKIKSHFENELSQQINERRERLKKFNYKFKTSLKERQEMEEIPAYERNGIKLSEYKHERPSRYIVDEDSDNNIKIRPNHFLHDNVD